MCLLIGHALQYELPQMDKLLIYQIEMYTVYLYSFNLIENLKISTTDCKRYKLYQSYILSKLKVK